MLSITSKQKEKANRLATFFTSLGIEANTRYEKKGIFVDVFDKRDERCLLMYTMRLLDDGNSLRFESFQVIAPKIRVVLSEGYIELFAFNPQIGRHLFSLMWKVKTPLIFQINYSILRSLVQEPTRFFLFVRLSDQKYIDPLYLKYFETCIGDCIFSQEEDLDSKIKASLDGLKSEDLNTTAL
jgi:hypothetical protein